MVSFQIPSVREKKFSKDSLFKSRCKYNHEEIKI